MDYLCYILDTTRPVPLRKLDPESLDLTINTLIDLQQGGRMVGVISHVPELKERIYKRVDVVVGKVGSSLRVRV